MKRQLIALLLGLVVQLSYGQTELKESYQRGVKLLQSSDYKNSVDTFSYVLSKATDNGLKKFCYIYRAFSYNGLGESKKAVADFDKAIEIDPTDLASYIDRGKTKAATKDLAGAKKDFEYVLTMDNVGDPAQAAFYYLGKISYQQTLYAESVKYYDKLIALAPNDYEAYFNRAAAKGMMMENEGSIKDYDRAIELKPNYMEAYANRGVAKINRLREKGNIKLTNEQTVDACTDLKKARDLGDKTVEDMIYIHCGKN